MHARSARRRGVVAAGVSGALVLGLLVSVPMLAGAAAGDPTPAPGDYRPNLVTSSGPAFSTTTAVVVGLPSFRVPIAEGSSTFINNRWGGADAASGRSVLLGLDGRLYEGVDREQGYDRGLRLANVADPDMRFIKLRAGNEPGHNGGPGGGRDIYQALGTDGSLWYSARSSGGGFQDSWAAMQFRQVSLPQGEIVADISPAHVLTESGRLFRLSGGIDNTPALGEIAVPSEVVFQRFGDLRTTMSATAYVAVIDEDGVIWEVGGGSGGWITVGIAGERVAQVTGTRDTRVALTESGKVFSWGGQECGELGNGSKDASQATPTQVMALADVRVTKIFGAPASPAAIDDQGHAWWWGPSDGVRSSCMTTPQPLVVPEGEKIANAIATDGLAYVQGFTSRWVTEDGDVLERNPLGGEELNYLVQPQRAVKMSFDGGNAVTLNAKGAIADR